MRPSIIVDTANTPPIMANVLVKYSTIDVRRSSMATMNGENLYCTGCQFQHATRTMYSII